MGDEIRAARFADLDVGTFHDMAKIRIDVFVVEQDAPYPELDGRDDERGTVHWWIERDGEVVSVLRVLDEGDGVACIGRVVTAAAFRGEGLSGALLNAALAELEGPSVIKAQAHLEEWYGRFGFLRTGPNFMEDGIPHAPMERPAT
jgi:ElaA protein